MEFSEQHGRIVVGRPGMQTVEGLYCVICGACSALEGVLNAAGMPSPDPEALARHRLTNELFQFWLGCAYEVIRQKFATEEAPLVMETLCARTLRGSFPDSEVCLVGRLSESEKDNLAELAEHFREPSVYRLVRLIDRVPDGERISPFRVSVRFKPFLIETFVSDCGAVLTAIEPHKLGLELMNSFSDRCDAFENSVDWEMKKQRSEGG